MDHTFTLLVLTMPDERGVYLLCDQFWKSSSVSCSAVSESLQPHGL